MSLYLEHGFVVTAIANCNTTLAGAWLMQLYIPAKVIVHVKRNTMTLLCFTRMHTQSSGQSQAFPTACLATYKYVFKNVSARTRKRILEWVWGCPRIVNIRYADTGRQITRLSPHSAWKRREELAELLVNPNPAVFCNQLAKIPTFAKPHDRT